MIIGLLILGSFLGIVAASILLILGQPFWLAALGYVGVGALVTVAIPLVCLWRARRRETSRDSASFLTDS